MEQIVSWKGLNEILSVENCRLLETKSGFLIESNITGRDEGISYHCAYSILTDSHWQTREVTITSLVRMTRHVIEMKSLAPGQWQLGNKEIKEFIGCLDVDISVTPFTNSLPVSRLSLKTGESKIIPVIYINILKQKVSRTDQVYTRLSKNTYRFETASGDFKADIIVDDEGLVLDYPPLFQRV